MSIFDQNIALRKTIQDFCDARDKAIKDYEMVLSFHKRIASDLSVIGPYLMPYESEPRCRVEQFRLELDKRMWRLAFDSTEIPKYMDEKARRDFEYSLDRETPEFTFDNIKSSLVTAASQADEFFARGLFEMFRSRTNWHETNREAFRLPEKAIWSGMVSGSFGGRRLQVSYRSDGKLNDLDRVFSVLAGEPFVPRSLEYAINNAWKDGANTYEGPLFKIRGFANGNMHIWFKRQDLVDKANQIIASYAGAAIAQDRT